MKTNANKERNTIPGSLKDSTSAQEELELYRRMLLIRRFEEKAAELYSSGEIPGFIHLAIGQEASAVGALFHAQPGDLITSTHRGHGHALAKGLSPERMFAELMGRESGVCSGRGGSLHIADPEKGILGANGIVGAGIPIAVGASFASQLRSTGNIVISFLGDGAVATGAFHEAANLASLWQLPIIFFCENNGYSEFSRFEDQHPVTLEQRAGGYGLQFLSVDGTNVLEVAGAMRLSIEKVRADSEPLFVEAKAIRAAGHYQGDPQRYRSESEQMTDDTDPIEQLRPRLLSRLGLTLVQRVEQSVQEEIEQAARMAEAAPWPDPSDLLANVTRTLPSTPDSQLAALVGPEFVAASSTGDVSPAEWKYYEAVKEALTLSLEEDDRVFLAGVDVGTGGNVFGITRGLHERWPDRVRDTPISETAIMGLAVGAAMTGLSPVVELMYLDFVGVCFDQILNQAAKLNYMTGGRARMALTIRSQFGAGRSSGAQHSQSLEVLFAHIPGLTVVMPSTPEDAYGMLRSAIDDPNPVLVLENRNLYGSRGVRCDQAYRVPIGEARVRRVGSDLTIVSYSRMVHESEQAASELSMLGVEAEVIDLRTIAPLDMHCIATSVSKTGRLMIVHEAVSKFGVGAEIAARITEESFWGLDAPIVRLGAKHSPTPYSPPLERAWLPSVNEIVQAAVRLCAA